MKIHPPLILVAYLTATLGASRGETLLDVNALLASGEVTITHSPIDSGDTAAIFDSNSDSRARSANVNPMVITLGFTDPTTFSAFRTRFLAGENRWRMVAANTLADLDARSGSYRILTNWTQGPEVLWSETGLADPQTYQWLRFTLVRLNGSGNDDVLLTDLELVIPEKPIAIETYSVPFELSWNSHFNAFYQIDGSSDLQHWADAATVRAVGESTAWQPEPAPSEPQQFYRVSSISPESRSHTVKKVLVLNYDPILESKGGMRLHTYLSWNDPRTLTTDYLADLNAASGDYVRWELVDFIDVDEWPLKADGFRYTDASFLEAWETTRSFHSPDGVDYARIVDDHELDRRVSEGEVDEVILWGGPYFGYWESHMVGSAAYWCNSSPLLRPDTPIYVIMGLNYERGVAEALHSFGHRVESIMRHVYGSWSGGSQINHLWDRFSRYDKIAPDLAACGSIHFPPNGQSDYDYNNSTAVLSSADDWLDFPNLTGAQSMVAAGDWGGTQRGYMNWWLARLPKAPGRNPDGMLNNWWAYLVDMNLYPESR